MQERRYTKKEALEYGWKVYLERPGFFILLMIGVSMVQYIPTYLESSQGAGPGAVTVLAVLIQTLVGVGVIGAALKIATGEEAGFRDLIKPQRVYLNYFVGSVIYGFAVFAGSLLFIIPGIIIGIMFSFYGYLIVDRGMGFAEALKMSKEMVEGYKMDLFWMWTILFIINILGGLLLLVGLLITTPVSIMSITYIYKKLLRG